MKKSSVLIPLSFLVAGFLSAYIIFDTNSSMDIVPGFSSDEPVSHSGSSDKIANPFLIKDTDESDVSRIDYLEVEVKKIKQQLEQINLTLQDLSRTAGSSSDSRDTTVRMSDPRPASALRRRLYNLENLIRGGIDQTTAEDIVRRKNNIELKRLELQDRATREGYLNTARYFDELAAIDQVDINLREELGVQGYDEYLYNSKQNNRIRVSSVMLGSPAERVGIKKGDVVLSYDDKRMFTWQELKDATTGGSLGEFVSINIYREGEIYSFTIPRGPLGMELGATRLEPR